MTCQHCGKLLSRLKMRRDGDFCSREHRDKYHLRQGLNRVQEAHEFSTLARRRETPLAVRLGRLACPSPASRRRVCAAAAPIAGRHPWDSFLPALALQGGPRIATGKASFRARALGLDRDEAPRKRLPADAPGIRSRAAAGQLQSNLRPVAHCGMPPPAAALQSAAASFPATAPARRGIAFDLRTAHEPSYPHRYFPAVRRPAQARRPAPRRAAAPGGSLRKRRGAGAMPFAPGGLETAIIPDRAPGLPGARLAAGTFSARQPAPPRAPGRSHKTEPAPACLSGTMPLGGTQERGVRITARCHCKFSRTCSSTSSDTPASC